MREGWNGEGHDQGGLQDLYLVVADVGIEAAIGDGLNHALEEAVGIGGVFGDAGYAEYRGLPYVVGIYLGDGDVELVADSGGDGLDYAPLGLQRVALGDVESEGTDSYDQDCLLRAKEGSGTLWVPLAASGEAGHESLGTLTLREPALLPGERAAHR